MSPGLGPLFRRIILLALLGAIGGAAFKMLRDRQAAAPTAPAEWPPFEPAFVPTPSATARSDHDSVPANEPSHGADVTNFADATGHTGTPDGFPVKVKQSSRIFHVPGGRFYDRTIADRHYTTAAAAQADGYRASTY